MEPESPFAPLLLIHSATYLSRAHIGSTLVTMPTLRKRVIGCFNDVPGGYVECHTGNGILGQTGSLASAAHSAHYSISCVTFCIPTGLGSFAQKTLTAPEYLRAPCKPTWQLSQCNLWHGNFEEGATENERQRQTGQDIIVFGVRNVRQCI